MKIKLLLITICSIISASVYAAVPADSIGVENLNGKKVVLHKLDPKDNYFSVGRRYNVKPNVIIQFNNNAPLIIGNVIKVPTELPFVQTVSAQQNKVAAQPAPLTPAESTVLQQYKVSAGETLYAISKRFDTTVDNLTHINSLTSTSLSAGQILKVPNGTAEPVIVQRPVVKRDSTTTVLVTDSLNIERRGGANKFGLFEKSEKGVATWIDDPSLDASKKLALHRTAPIGTVIKITNPMTGHTAFAKVVGRINDSEATKDVIVVMTKNVAESIGASDKRVRVNISYGSPNE